MGPKAPFMAIVVVVGSGETDWCGRQIFEALFADALSWGGTYTMFYGIPDLAPWWIPLVVSSLSGT